MIIPGSTQKLVQVVASLRPLVEGNDLKKKKTTFVYLYLNSKVTETQRDP